MLSLIIVIFVFGVLVLVHEAGHLFAAKKSGVGVEIFSIGMGKKLFGKTFGETEYRLSLIPFGGYCKLEGEDISEAKGRETDFVTKPIIKRFWVIAAGSLTNYAFAFLLFSIIFMVGVPTLSNTVGQVLNDYPAAKAGIVEGDKIVSIDGFEVVFWEDILEQVGKYKKNDKPLEINIERNSEVMSIKLVPDVQEMKNIFGNQVQRPMIGVGPRNEMIYVPHNVVDAVFKASERIVGLTGLTYKMMWHLVTGSIPLKGTVSGPIGIAFFIKEAAHNGIVPVLIVMAHISMALAIFNLLPFPVLDGGHILFLLIEKIKGRPVDEKVINIISNIAVGLLITFAVFISFNDVKKFANFGSHNVADEKKANTETVTTSN